VELDWGELRENKYRIRNCNNFISQLVVCFLEHNNYCCQLNCFASGAMTLHFPHLPYMCGIWYMVYGTWDGEKHHYHFWNATLTLTWLQDAMLMQLPSVTNTLTSKPN